MRRRRRPDHVAVGCRPPTAASPPCSAASRRSCSRTAATARDRNGQTLPVGKASRRWAAAGPPAPQRCSGDEVHRLRPKSTAPAVDLGEPLVDGSRPTRCWLRVSRQRSGERTSADGQTVEPLDGRRHGGAFSSSSTPSGAAGQGVRGVGRRAAVVQQDDGHPPGFPRGGRDHAGGQQRHHGQRQQHAVADEPVHRVVGEHPAAMPPRHARSRTRDDHRHRQLRMVALIPGRDGGVGQRTVSPKESPGSPAEAESRGQRPVQSADRGRADGCPGPGNAESAPEHWATPTKNAVLPGQLVDVAILATEILGRGDDGGEHQHRGGDHPQVADVGRIACLNA